MRNNSSFLKYLILPGILITFVFYSGCKTKAKPYEPVYTTDLSPKKVLLFGVPTQSYFEIHDLFVKYLNERLKGAEVQTVAISNFLGYNDKLDNRYFDITIVNGMSALEQTARN